VIIDDSEAPSRIKVSVGTAQREFDLERLGGLDQLWEVTLALRDIFRFVQTQIEDPERRRDIEYAAINGMLSSLDPHSILLKPESFDEVKLSTKGEFGGLGIVISIRDGALTIISPIGGTPASRAGLKAKDKIVKIGEESTVNMSLEEAVGRLRGKPGTKVNIWVLRKGWTEARRFAMTRAIIKIESVTSEMLEDDIGYVRIKSFQANTFDDLHTHLERLRRRARSGAIKGLVLDLRNNPGGLLDQAILVSDRFVERGPLVITVGEGNRKRDVKSAHVSGTDVDYPIAVLVNGGSASASEIVSGALKNHDRAIVVGQQTFGKGSVQVLYDFKDRSALKLTIAQYLTPGDLSIQSIGITPDIEVVPATISKEGIHLFVDDDSPREKDLERHLDTPETDDRGKGAGPERKGVEPATRIVDLLPAADADEEPPDDVDAFEYDYEIRLAHDVLAQARSTNRSAILEESAQLFDQRAQEAEAKIVERLEEVGVDWSVGPPSGAPRASIDLRINGRAGDTTVTAGETVKLTATVRNLGDTPLYRVYGVTKSEDPLLTNLEFAFGKVGPGLTRTWETSVKLPRDMTPRADEVSLALGDAHGHTTEARTGAVVSIADVAKPRFTYAYALDDKKGGNGDGVLQVGEQVTMHVDVRNVGPGAAEDVVVTLKNLASKAVFLKEGRAKVGAMARDGKASAELKFALRSQADAVTVRLTIYDAALGESASEELRLPVVAARRAKPERRALKVKDRRNVPVYVGADAAMPVLGQVKAGAILRADASFGTRWWRVAAGKGSIGFVRSADVVAQKGYRRPTQGAVRPVEPQAPPAITLELGDLVTSAPSMRLLGGVSDERHLQDVYVFVNDKKVYYRSLQDAQPGSAGVRAPLDLILPLNTGSNFVTVVARESPDLVTRRTFGLYREPGGAVAERGVPTPQAQ
jgi:carboxyl-terminal processing protease